MDTPLKHAALRLRQARTLSVAGCTALLLLARAGSAEASSLEPLPVENNAPLPTDGCATSDCKLPPPDMMRINCPTGGCDPGDGNSKGIYIANESDYCLENPFMSARLCPEAFINTKDGVQLWLRDAKQSQLKYPVGVSARLTAFPYPEQPITLVSIHADKTWLVVRYRKLLSSVVHTVSGSALGALRLRFSFVREWPSHTETHNYEMKVDSVDWPEQELPPGRQLHRYTLSYRQVGSNASWTPHCMLSTGSTRVSFLGGKQVDGLTAEVQDKPEVTTVSCETGAIDQCIDWGYAPWNPQTGWLEASDYLFRSCLQAKRAAYFVGFGDVTSYTRNGTPIARRDQFGVNTEPIERLEALWSPLGAECINVENRRLDDLPPLPWEFLQRVPRCEPVQWTHAAKLATGRLLPSYSAP